jgi:hypothetical protein
LTSGTKQEANRKKTTVSYHPKFRELINVTHKYETISMQCEIERNQSKNEEISRLNAGSQIEESSAFVDQFLTKLNL